jgi:hypothetical protein
MLFSLCLSSHCGFCCMSYVVVWLPLYAVDLILFANGAIPEVCWIRMWLARHILSVTGLWEPLILVSSPSIRFIDLKNSTAVVLKISVFWGTTPFVPMKVIRRFERTLIHLHNRKIIQVTSQREACSKQICDWFLDWLIIRPWKWRQHVLPKRRLRLLTDYSALYPRRQNFSNHKVFGNFEEIITCITRGRPPLWSSDQSSWLQIQMSGFDSRHNQVFWVVSLERGPLSLVSTIEELLERESSCSGLENREYGRRGSAAFSTRHPFFPQKLALTSPTSGGCSVCIVRSRTQAKELVYFPGWFICCSC